MKKMVNPFPTPFDSYSTMFPTIVFCRADQRRLPFIAVGIVRKCHWHIAPVSNDVGSFQIWPIGGAFR
jgi:hypothetical protein